MTDEPVALDVRLIAPGLSLWLPAALAVALNFMRPDLMQPMLDHVFGYLLVGASLLLTLGGAAATTLAAFAPLESLAGRVVVAVLGVVFCTFPAVFLILCGPIVFAFMYGNVAG